METPVMVYVIIVESEDGFSSQVHGVRSSKEVADQVQSELQSALGDDNVVVVEEHELL